MREALVEQRLGNLLQQFGGVAAPKTPNQIVVDIKFRLRLAALTVREALVEQRPGNPL